MNLHYEKIFREHLPELMALWNDPEVIRFTNIKAPCGETAACERIDRFAGEEVYAIFADDTLTGVAGCLRVEDEPECYGLFYQIKKCYWDKGIATAAAGWIIAEMQKKHPNAAFIAEVVEENAASVKILQALGFVLTAQYPSAFERDGHSANILSYLLG